MDTKKNRIGERGKGGSHTKKSDNVRDLQNVSAKLLRRHVREVVCFWGDGGVSWRNTQKKNGEWWNPTPDMIKAFKLLGYGKHARWKLI